MNTITKNLILAPLNLLFCINKEVTLRILFRLQQGYKLDLKNPSTYSEKLQWIKLYYKNPIITKLVDKYLVREYVSRRCPELIVPILWHGFDPRDIPWDALPEKFVIKVTHGSGFNIICKDKNKINTKKVEKKLKIWLKTKFLKCYGEWFYGVEKPRIIIEKFLDCGTGDVPVDYKVMCFSDKAKYIIVDTDRFTRHKRNVYDINWRFIEGVTLGFPNDQPISPPNMLDSLLEYAEILSKGFPHVRVDFYIVNGRIYFGEMTFTNGAGFDRIVPYEFDLELGSLLELPKREL